MADDDDPPRKFYDLKSRNDFERANPTTKAPSDGPTDVQGFLKSAAADARTADVNSPGNRRNEVHEMLEENLKRDQAAGWYKVSLAPDPRRIRRVRNFWILLLAVDVPLGGFIWLIGPAAVLPFVCAIAGFAMFTAVLIWHTWFLRTEN